MKDNDNKIKASNTFILRSKANNGNLTKQVCIILTKEDSESCLVIKKYSLTTSLKDYKKLGFKVVKKYKNYYLVCQLFSIQLKSLDKIINWMNSLTYKEK